MRIPRRTRNATKEVVIIVASQSQVLGPRTREMGWSEGRGLNHFVLIFSFAALFGVGGAFSLVTKASIFRLREERSEMVEDIGRRRSSIERSAEVLKAQTRRMFGVGLASVVLL